VTREPESILALVDDRARFSPGSVALVAPGRPPATYEVLLAQVRRVAGAMRARGIAPADRVALVVEGGPEAASAFLGISSASVCAPLNPAYRRDELDFYLSDLRARAVVVSGTLQTEAREIARRRGIDVIELISDDGQPAGVFDLDGPSTTTEVVSPPAAGEALVLHTSGTTARPKIVPLAHRHLLASARNVRRSLELGAADRCLNVMPLFHIHGLVAALLASLEAGASVVCSPGFHQVRWFEWLRETAPTWATAVPTMHQAILERARREPGLVQGHSLRFVRSSSAALPVPVLEGLEDVLGVPVVEAYGMTEAAHQIASNPLPPGTRKPGSVGLPAGPEIAILDPDGRELSVGEVGEVAIRGDSVFVGYESNPDANSSAFSGGWFRTGDQGRLDGEGYLTLLGRLKEIINRGGEKVSPLEVDDVLLRHPAVAQAVTFGMPDERLGEEVAAAVVVRSGAAATERELQDFVAETIAPFKVPRRIVAVEEIPKGPTGKVQRISLAEQLDVDSAAALAAPAQSAFLEESIRGIWSDVLGVPEVDSHGDFFALGGDSILGAEAVARIRDLLDRPDLPLIALVRAPTPRGMVAEIEEQLGWGTEAVVPLNDARSGRPLFIVHGVDGDVVRFAAFARLLNPGRPVYGLRAIADGSDGAQLDSIENIASRYLAGLRRIQPHGPYLIASYCMGAAVAAELADRLEAVGEQTMLVLLDPRLRRPGGLRYALWLAQRRLRQGRLLGAVWRRVRRRGPVDFAIADATPTRNALAAAREAYVPTPTRAPAAVLCSEDFGQFEMPPWYLRAVFRRTVITADVPGDHTRVFQQPHVVTTTLGIAHALARLESSEARP
jgi:acyl-CoA synthetase (AMP-forming)/AMP-acid ligase II